MARQKNAGKEILTSEARLAGQQSIDPALDLGSGLTNAAYAAQIQKTRDSLAEYNKSLSTSDQLLNAYNADIKELKTYSERSLKAVGVRYGFDGSEHETADGACKSEDRKTRTKTGES